jgi:hypothetical protein
VGSNPTAALALVALLTVLRFVGEHTKGAIMSKKHWKSKSVASASKRTRVKLALIVVHFFETVWATGASLAAAMAFSTSTH